MYIIKTRTNVFFCENKTISLIRLSEVTAFNKHIVTKLKQLQYGEAVKFPNGLHIMKANSTQLEKARSYVKRRKPQQRIEDVGTYL